MDFSHPGFSLVEDSSNSFLIGSNLDSLLIFFVFLFYIFFRQFSHCYDHLMVINEKLNNKSVLIYQQIENCDIKEN